MKEYRISNRTSGRVEIKAYRKVLDPGQSFTVIAPLDEEIYWKKGEGKLRVVMILEEESSKKEKIKPGPDTMAAPPVDTDSESEPASKPKIKKKSS